jgi:hypothetical protein
MSDAEAQVEESGSLLAVAENDDQAQQEPEAMPHLEGQEQPAEADDSIDWGNRPDWMPANFWTDNDGPDLEGLSKSYNELRSKFSQGQHKAPKDGNYDISSLTEAGVAEDDAMLSDFRSYAKDVGMSQEQFNTLTSMYMQHIGAQMDEAETSREAEIAKLGPKADKLLKSTNQWLGKMSSSGVMTDDEINALVQLGNTAAGVRALNKIRESYGERSIPDVTVQESQQYTRAELDAMVGDPRYKTDPAYREKVEQLFIEMYS